MCIYFENVQVLMVYVLNAIKMVPMGIIIIDYY